MLILGLEGATLYTILEYVCMATCPRSPGRTLLLLLLLLVLALLPVPPTALSLCHLNATK